ncbi:MAG: hypothetical protein KJ592_02155 [Nanoarchaeota archaeon]|nr:hypothetical protein [Nanoarchaeota archaeon]
MIFDSPFFTEMLLPFLLVFVVVFAILQKTKVLGEGKAQIDALVGLVVGLILIGVPGPRDFVVGVMPWLAVGVAVLLVFLILYGFVAGDLSQMGKSKKWVLPLFGVMVFIFVAGVVLYVGGLWDNVLGLFTDAANSAFWMNVVMVVLIVGAMAVAVFGGKKNPATG